ncbi:hypothetical protein KYY02_17160 [Streptomyces pimonensis]|uniref:Uncharacterized protein n=1 Tax=Streptomyces pimonensis TaxID=2860288 RepID=A0ABV4J3G7_9ACTN
MPFNVDMWVEDRDDGRFTVYVDRKLITKRGAQIMQQMLSTTVTGWQRLDEVAVRTALRAVTG